MARACSTDKRCGGQRRPGLSLAEGLAGARWFCNEAPGAWVKDRVRIAGVDYAALHPLEEPQPHYHCGVADEVKWDPIAGKCVWRP
ncbi:MAG: hypothetical protein F4X58_01090 [Chloroflexi bacterium]|nr:hypothetical protein [Chloroflexota bacterium]MYC00501.1 hypothetical protein [Chloroflexota bacterium]